MWALSTFRFAAIRRVAVGGLSALWLACVVPPSSSQPSPASDAAAEADIDAAGEDPVEAGCVEHTDSFRLEGQLSLPAGMHGSVELVFWESEHYYCGADPGVSTVLTPGERLALVDVPSDDPFAVDLAIRYLTRRPTIEVFAYFDEPDDGTPACDAGGAWDFPAEDQTGLVLELEPGDCSVPL